VAGREVKPGRTQQADLERSIKQEERSGIESKDARKRRMGPAKKQKIEIAVGRCAREEGGGSSVFLELDDRLDGGGLEGFRGC
jgi:hypothetical protein